MFLPLLCTQWTRPSTGLDRYLHHAGAVKQDETGFTHHSGVTLSIQEETRMFRRQNLRAKLQQFQLFQLF